MYSPFLKQCFVSGTVSFTTIGHGVVLGFTAILLPQEKEPDAHIVLDDEQGSWIASVLAITLMVGSFMAPPIMGRMGRKVAHLVVIATVLIGWIVMLLAKSFAAMMIGRIIHGISFGLMLPLRSVLLGEYTSPKNRGAFLTMVSSAQSLGILLVHLIGSLVPWQKCSFILAAFPLASFFMTFFIPESPSWLAAKSRYEDCRKAFRWVRGDGEEEELEEMIRARMSESNRATISNCNDLLVLFKKKEFYKPIVIMIHSYFMGEFSGGSLMSCYSTIVIHHLAGPEVDAHMWMIALDVQRNITNLIAVFVVNKVKRRTMYMATAGLSIISDIAIACYVYAKLQGWLTYTAVWLPFLLINIQFFTVAFGIVGLPYIIAGEIFPLEYRSVGGSISIVSISIAYFLIMKTFAAMVGSIGLHGCFTVYAAVVAYTLFVVWWLLPETKGRTLQQIEEQFRGKALVPKDNRYIWK